MAEISSSTTLHELAAIISQALEAEGILATLSGGAAVSLYTNNRYQSKDLDFVSSASTGRLAKAVKTLGFVGCSSASSPGKKSRSSDSPQGADVNQAFGLCTGAPNSCGEITPCLKNKE